MKLPTFVLVALLSFATNAFADPDPNFYVFLCSDRASYSVGSSYFVDGGMLKTV